MHSDASFGFRIILEELSRKKSFSNLISVRMHNLLCCVCEEISDYQYKTRRYKAFISRSACH